MKVVKIKKIIFLVLFSERFDPAPQPSRANSTCYRYTNPETKGQKDRDEGKEAEIQRQRTRIVSVCVRGKGGKYISSGEWEIDIQTNRENKGRECCDSGSEV